MVAENEPRDVDNPGGEPRFGTGGSLCSSFVEFLPVTGVSISVVGGLGRQSTICSSDAIAARVEELQFELGEGPHWQALRTGKAVLVPDVRGGDQAQWPVFGASVNELAVGALFAFPLVMGAVTIGVVDMYRTTPGAFGIDSVAMALSLAGSVAAPALHLAGWSAGEEIPVGRGEVPEMRREVHQATGMVLAQLGTTATEAFFHLRAYAFSAGQTVEYVAHEVVMRRLDFRELIK